MECTIEEFASVLPAWYQRFTSNKYYEGWIELLHRLPSKAQRCGHFDIEDLSDIADWGGNQHGVKQRMASANTPQQVRMRTSEAFLHRQNPDRAIGAILKIDQWGLSYGSKTLVLMDPSNYGILDRWIRRSLENVIPRIYDGHKSSMVRGYLAYLDVCSQLQRGATGQLPKAQDQWRRADIGQALFEFARSGGVLTPSDHAQ